MEQQDAKKGSVERGSHRDEAGRSAWERPALTRLDVGQTELNVVTGNDAGSINTTMS